MTRRKQREPNPNPAVPFGDGLAIRAGGGGHIHAVTYDGEPLSPLGPLPPRPEVVVHDVPTRPATAEELAHARRSQQGPPTAQEPEDWSQAAGPPLNTRGTP